MKYLVYRFSFFVMLCLLHTFSTRCQDLNTIKGAYSSYFGGNSADRINAIQIDKQGFLYVAGNTKSTNFPISSGAYCQSHKGELDGFVAKIDINSNKIVWSTYIGGSGVDYLSDMKIDNNGDVFIIGNTLSSDFPTTANAYDRNFNGASGGNHGDLYIAKIKNDGSDLIYSTFLGGSGTESFENIEIDSRGCAYICASTSSKDYPVTQGALDTTFNGYNSGEYLADIVITKLSPDGSKINFSTYFGGRGNETAKIRIDSNNNVIVFGSTSSLNLPVTNTTTFTCTDTTYMGGNLFIAILNPDGKKLEYCSYLPGSKPGSIGTIYCYNPNTAIIAGTTAAPDLPVSKNAYQKNIKGEKDAFLMQFDLKNKSINYCTYIGGSKSETGTSLVKYSENKILLSGNTLSDDFPVSNNALDKSYNGCANTQYPWGGDYFISAFNLKTGRLDYSSYIGGTGDDYWPVLLVKNDTLIIGGSSKSDDFPVTNNAISINYNGGNMQGGDGIIMEFSYNNLLNLTPNNINNSQK